jgi:hypothetical protein
VKLFFKLLVDSNAVLSLQNIYFGQILSGCSLRTSTQIYSCPESSSHIGKIYSCRKVSGQVRNDEEEAYGKGTIAKVIKANTAVAQSYPSFLYTEEHS